MEKKIITLAVAGVLCAPLSTQAVEVAGDLLHVYGKIHVSVDNSDTDGLNTASYSDGISISSNSSRLGFKGKYKQVIYQIEQEVRIDDGSTGNFADRDTFIGYTGNWGAVMVGRHDTPFKLVGSYWGVFGDAVGERRAILGAGHQNGNQLNERASNMMMYEFKNKIIKAQAMYAVEPKSGSNNVDNNEQTVLGGALWWNIAGFTLSAGYEDWTGHPFIIDGNAYRLAALWKIAGHQIGAIYENIDPSIVNEFSRAAYGINWKWKFINDWDVRLQYLVADSAENATDTGGSKIGAGVYHQLNDETKLYVSYGATSNDNNAKFQAVDGGHGDEVKTVNGGNPSSLSLGIEFKF
jgi:predicted porin